MPIDSHQTAASQTNPLAGLAGRLRDAIAHAGDIGLFCVQTLWECARTPVRGRIFFAHAFHLGLRAMPVALMTGLFVGMVIVLQTGYQLATFNAKSYAAMGAAKALTQIMLPIFTALVVGARTAASIAAELGTMRVTEQIDAMTVLDVEPRRYLIVPRVLATVVMLPVITIYVDAVGLAGGWLMGVSALHIPGLLYWTVTFRWLQMSDLLIGIVKTFFFGGAMGLCGCYFGYKASGGAEGVGVATTRAVVATLITIILLEFILSSWSLFLLDLLSGKSSS